MSRGLIIAKDTPGLAKECTSRKLELCVGTCQSLEQMPYTQNLFMGIGRAAHWELLEAAWALLESWDVIAPLYSYELLAKDVSSHEDRKTALRVCGDLRQPLYDAGMVFIHNNNAGQRFYTAWREQGGSAELALLRAIHLAKPIILQAPYSWLGMNRTGASDVNPRTTMPGARHAPRSPGPNLVKVQIGPNRFVMCRPGEEEATKRHFEEMAKSARSHRGQE